MEAADLELKKMQSDQSIVEDESVSVDKPQLCISTMRRVELMMPIAGELSRSRYPGFEDTQVREPMGRGRAIVREKSDVAKISKLEESLVEVQR
jgi:hypothetical protein